MEELLNNFVEYLRYQDEAVLYIVLFFSAIIENLFPPVPGDTITAFGAFLVGIQKLNYFLVYLFTTLGSVVGFMSLFFLARLLNREFFIRKNYRFFDAESIINAEKWYHKYGYFIVMANRFFPGIRSVISIVSGILRLSIPRVLVFSLISASIWNLIWIHVGYTLGNNWEIVKKKMSIILRQYNTIVGIVLLLIILAFVIFKIIRKKQYRSKET